MGHTDFMNQPILRHAKDWSALGQSAYEAYCKTLHSIVDEGYYSTSPWAELNSEYRLCWVAVAKQMWAEHSAMRNLVAGAFAMDSEPGDPHGVPPGKPGL